MAAGNDTHDADRLGLTATIIASVFAALIRVGVRVITTFTHRQLPPLGVIAGLLIVAASTASAFELSLVDQGVADAHKLVPVTFLVVVATVVVYGLTARAVARALGVAEP